MATNKVNQFVGQYRTDSFDRFGDDLCELLLSYLSFEDKYRLKGVSKQWQRLILNKQRVLEISKEIENGDNLRQLLKTVKYVKTCDVNRLKNVLKTCPALKAIRFSDYIRVDDQVLDTITQFCPSLESIVLEMNFCSKEAITRFVERFGQTLKSIHLKDSDLFDPQNHREYTFDEYMLEQYMFDEIEDINDVNCLKRLVIDGPELEDIFATVSRLAPNLQTLILKQRTWEELKTSVDFSLMSPMPSLKALAIVNYSLIGQLFEALPRMTPNLRVLRLKGPLIYNYNRDVTDKKICHLIDNCPQLNDIELSFRTLCRITSKTIDKLRETANKRPKVSIAFTTFVGNNNEVISHWNSISDKPKNLLITLKR